MMPSAFFLSRVELKTTLALAVVFFLRMLALFMLLPVLILAGEQYDSSRLLLGIALGIYGLTQAALQIPFGMLSDRYGRKPIIVLGLVVFILGSILAGRADSVYGLILGRALQGAGAIAAAIMALAADLSRAEVRTQIMAGIGVSIGLAFVTAFVLGPIFYSVMGFEKMCYLAAGLGAVAIVVLLTVVPTPEQQQGTTAVNRSSLQKALFDRRLWHLYFSIFVSHMMLMANFVVVPILLRDFVGLPAGLHWQPYLIAFFVSLCITAPLVIWGGRLGQIKLFLLAGVVLMMGSQLSLCLFSTQIVHIVIALVAFFGAFNYLEALLPAEVSKIADQKGTALGVYSTAQFIGIFSGGLLGGALYEYIGIMAVHGVCLLLAVLWFLVLLPKKHAI